MDTIIMFFRDTLSGPVYIATVIVAVILIFACIGYLAEKSINNKKEAAKYATVSEESTAATPIADPVITPSTNNVAAPSEVVTPPPLSNAPVSTAPMVSPTVVEPITNKPVSEVVSPPSTPTTVSMNKEPDNQSVVLPSIEK